MSKKVILASFAHERDLLGAARAVRERNWEIIDVYAPYAVHGLEELLGWRRSRLSAACFLGGTAGLGLALWFQFWASATDWPLNVGGRPWNSLPAFVPVAFESMVLLAGFSLVFAWLFRCGLYPGKAALLPLAGLTDNRFGLAVRDPGAATGMEAVRELLHDYHTMELAEQNEGERQA
jgi:hypothetical protein